MNVEELKKVVAGYCKKDGVPEDFVTGDFDFILQALNNARIEAEQLRDFELSKVTVVIPIDTCNGALLDTATLMGYDEQVDIKSIRSGGIRGDSGYLHPVPVIGKETYLARHQRDIDWVNNVNDRYRGDFGGYSECDETQLLVQGNVISLNPRSNTPGTIVNAELIVVRWLGPYQDNSDCDFLTQFCPNYMQWAAIVEVNHLTQMFVARQEGGLNSPKDLKANAWKAVETWDDFLVEGGRTPLLNE